jgi:STE24 endopeptidase
MIGALKKLSVDNLTNLTPHPLKVALSYSHPPVLARIQALRHLMREEPGCGQRCAAPGGTASAGAGT